MKIPATFVLAWALPAASAWPQDPSETPAPRRARPVRVQSSVRVIIEEHPEGEYEYEAYEQALPVGHRSRAGNGTASLGSDVWYRTVCRPQEDDRTPAPVFVPSPPLPELSLSATFSRPRLGVTVPAGAPGRPRVDPIISKSSLFGSGSGTVTNTDAPFLYGPDVDLLLEPDVTAWRPMRWMPDETSLHLYGRVLFGSFEVFDTPASLQLYSVGPRLEVPVLGSGSFRLGATVAAGPAFLHTGIGDAVGFDGGVGLRAEHVFSPGFSFVAAVEANLYASGNVALFGPAVNLGFNLSW